MNIRGGVTAIVGWGFIAVGVLFAFVVSIEAEELVLNSVTATGLPYSSGTGLYLWALLLFSAIVAGTGAGTVLFARSDRDWEEEGRLDPAPSRLTHRRRRRAVMWGTVVAVVAFLPGLVLMPIPHSFNLDLAVGVCSNGLPTGGQEVSLPSGTLLVYQWHSSNGEPVSAVSAPSGPNITSNAPAVYDTYSQYLFVNSTTGASTFTSNGSMARFSACDGPGSVGLTAGEAVLLVGTYYTIGF